MLQSESLGDQPKNTAASQSEAPLLRWCDHGRVGLGEFYADIHQEAVGTQLPLCIYSCKVFRLACVSYLAVSSSLII